MGFIMNICKGGRGKVAPYETTHVRVPIPVKSIVDKIVADYRESGIIPNIDKPVNWFNQVAKTTPKPKEQILSQLDEIRKTKKIGKDTINQILELIYGE